MKRFTFEFFPCRTLHLFFFTEVTNGDEILGQIRAGTLEMAFMSPSLIVDEFQVVAAAHRVLQDEARGKMVTKNLHSELVHTLSGAHHIAEGIRKFGMDVHHNYFLVALFDADDATIERLKGLVQGKETEVDQFKKHTVITKALQHYKISNDEKAMSDIVGSIVSRIATRGH